MKPILLIFILLAFLSTNCNKHSILSLNKKQKQIIAFVPLDDYNMIEIDPVIKEISGFYNKQVIVLHSVNIPGKFFNTALKQYSADSIIMLLSHLYNDTIVEIIGLIHNPVFTIKEVKPVPYYSENIFGMGYQPGNACVVSDFKFKTTDTKIFNQRLRNVIIHEVGHNLGLSHCPDDKCIMSKNNGNITTLDNSGNDYCNKCRNILNR
ncbi:MAG: putative archaelysin family metalloprotease precursor [Chitinophagaceae bacterium]|nr:putative archaelysin family metalloprotease precursor [Chitinophagaceae bacterium]MDB5221831.1 putative archaelysin family metalloprotease precursor [Chitinophagaceae bacterium]